MFHLHFTNNAAATTSFHPLLAPCVHRRNHERVSWASRPDGALLCNVLTFNFDQRPDFAALISLICAAIKV